MLHVTALLGWLTERWLKDDEPLEGVIRFNCCHNTQELSVAECAVANRVCVVRDFLFRLGLVGIYKEGPTKGIGYGNVSSMLKKKEGNENNAFVITSSQTGHISKLNPAKDTSVVFDYDFHSNVVSRGLSKPSSESMTHAAFYDAKPTTEAVLHIHSQKWWNTLLALGPTEIAIVERHVQYGTPELAEAVMKLVQDGPPCGLIVTAGHEDGVFFYGPALDITIKFLVETGMKRIQAINHEVMQDLEDVLKSLHAS